MRNSLLTDLLSYGVQTIDENNGKYTFFLTTNIGNFVCPPLFDKSIPVGSLIVAKVMTKVVDSEPQFDIDVLVACNSSLKYPPPEYLVKNNIYWGELTNLGLYILPDEEPS